MSKYTHGKDCTNQYWDAMSAFVDGELREAEAERLLAHVAVCARCAHELALLEHSKTEFAAMERAIPPAGLRESILRATTRRLSVTERLRAALSYKPATLGSVAAVGVLLFLLLRPTPQPVMSPVEGTGQPTTAEAKIHSPNPQFPLADSLAPAPRSSKQVPVVATARKSFKAKHASMGEKQTHLAGVGTLVAAANVRPGHIGSPRMIAVLPFDPNEQPIRYKPIVHEKPVGLAEAQHALAEAGSVIELGSRSETSTVLSVSREIADGREEDVGKPILTEETKERIKISLSERSELRFEQPTYRMRPTEGLTLIRGRF